MAECRAAVGIIRGTGCNDIVRLPLAPVVLALAVVVALSPTSLASTVGRASSPDPTATNGFTTDAVAVPPSVQARSMAASEPLEITVALAYPDPAGLDAFLRSVEDPASSAYRQFLSHAEFEARFAPSPSAAASVAATLARAGAAQVRVAPDGLSVSATLSVAEVDALFGVRMVEFPSEGGPVYTAVGTPQLPTGLRGLVSGIDGLTNAPDARTTDNLAIRSGGPVGRLGDGLFAHDNDTGFNFFVGSDFTNAFGADELLPGNVSSIANATFPTGLAIATLLASGYNQTDNVNTPPWDPNVVETYFNATLAPAWLPVSRAAPLVGVPVTVGGVTPPLPGPFGTINDTTDDSIENALDLEMAGSLAPGAGLYNFYFAGSLLASAETDADVASFFDQDLASALAYDYGSQVLGAISCSFGIADLNDTLWDQELEEAAAMGVTVIAASGDQGNAPNQLTMRSAGPWPLWPASAAFNLSGSVAVGGVSLDLGGAPAGWINETSLTIEYDANASGIVALDTWWDTTGGPGTYAGTEGGISTVYPEPDWQFHSAAQWPIANATVKQGVGTLNRAEPDIAFPGNSTIAFVYADAEGNVYYEVLEGTSIAAPAFAGLLTDEIAVSHHAFGFLDPELYRIGSYFWAHPGPSDPYLDVENGSNYFFSAGPGWDPTTGWGVPLGPSLYRVDANATIRDYVYTGPTPGLPAAAPSPPVPWTELFLIFGIGITVAVILVIALARPGRRERSPPPPPFGAAPPPPAPGSSLAAVPPPPGSYATFLCPYCGTPRPAEPVRCPRCGAF